MTDQEINEAIAEACGQRYHKPTEDEVKSGSYYQYEPDFCRSLDLMHVAESILLPEQQETFSGHLLDRLHFFVAHATARQRAEAFLKTIGKWRMKLFCDLCGRELTSPGGLLFSPPNCLKKHTCLECWAWILTAIAVRRQMSEFDSKEP